MTTEALYGYGSIFLVLLLTGIGLPPMPEEAGILYAAGLHALHPEVSWPFAWLACGLGIICADLVLYGAGRWWGPRLFEYRWVQRVMSAERRQRIETRFHRHGIKILLLARFLPPLRTGIFLIAGASRYAVPKFLLADGLYAVFGVGLFFFGGSWLIDLIKRSGHVAVYVAAVPLIGYGLYRYYRYLKKRELAAGAEPPVSVLEVPAGAVPEGKAAVRPEAAPAAMREAKKVLEG
ncbi:MAG TPA: DedA family protein [Gemmataceae bacterium]|nr:DedA family protein [Gemmataceae bacterium]